MPATSQTVIKVLPSLADVAAASWDPLANPPSRPFDPFLAHAFLKALEDAGAVSQRSGWLPQHLVLEQDDAVTGVMPCYLKSHSRGEYVFDYGWAEAYERAGGDYYPKLQAAVPFTPVPGRRLLVGSGPDAEAREQLLAVGAIELANRHGVSSVHVTFLSQGEATRLSERGFLRRTGQQFHWQNQGYATFDDFLANLASRKRKTIRRERAQALAAGLSVELVTGPALTEAHWDAFFEFYMDTGSRKWGTPYLNRKFFSLLGAAMPDRCLLIMARRGGRYVAGALNLIGGDCLYGRYWGCIEHHPYLHFELCYYQAMEYAIGQKLARVEAGAQGEHKLARGYMPTTTYSLHWIRDAGFRKAVARYLVEERAQVCREGQILAEYGPYKQVAAADEA